MTEFRKKLIIAAVTTILTVAIPTEAHALSLPRHSEGEEATTLAEANDFVEYLYGRIDSLESEVKSLTEGAKIKDRAKWAVGGGAAYSWQGSLSVFAQGGLLSPKWAAAGILGWSFPGGLMGGASFLIAL